MFQRLQISKQNSLSALALAIVFSSQLPAGSVDEIEDPELLKLVAIKKLMRAVHSVENVKTMLPGMRKAEESYVEAFIALRFAGTKDPKFSKLTEAQRQEKSQAAKHLIMDRYDKLLAEFDFPHEAETIWTVTVDKNLSLEEIKNLTAYWESPTGQKDINLQPQILAELKTQMDAELLPKMKELGARLNKERMQPLQNAIDAAEKNLKDYHAKHPAKSGGD